MREEQQFVCRLFTPLRSIGGVFLYASEFRARPAIAGRAQVARKGDMRKGAAQVMQQVDTRVRYMVRVAMLSAVSIILWMPIFEIPMFLPWLKLDFRRCRRCWRGLRWGGAGFDSAAYKGAGTYTDGHDGGHRRTGRLPVFGGAGGAVGVDNQRARVKNAARENHVSINRRSALDRHVDRRGAHGCDVGGHQPVHTACRCTPSSPAWRA